MGDFNVSCGISGLTINEGDKVGFALLVPSSLEPYHTTKLKEPRLMSVNSNDYYSSYVSPVYGVYDNYGRIAQVENTVSAQILEEIFGRPAADVVNAASNDERSAYFHGSPIYNLYYPNKEEIRTRYPNSDEDELLREGFVKEGDSFVFGKFTIQSVEAQQYTLISDHGNSRVTTRTVKKSVHKTVLENFCHTTGCYPGFNPEDYDAIHQLMGMSGMFFLKDIFKGMLTEHASWNDFAGHETWAEKAWTKFKETVTWDTSDAGKWLDVQFRLDDILTREIRLDEKHIHLLRKYYDHDDEFHETRHLNAMLQSVNRILEPSLIGNQYGNHEASVALHNITAGILAKRTAQYKEWNEEDEDYEEDENKQ
jgi:hypothetical protein